jgi:hypothetical protein
MSLRFLTILIEFYEIDKNHVFNDFIYFNRILSILINSY